MTKKTEDLLGYEIMRLLKASREHMGDDLLIEGLAGREKSADTVTRLMRFIVANFGQDESGVTEKFWTACEPVLEEAGLDDEQLKAIRYPYPRPGEPGFRSVLDEMRDEGRD